ncbi:hypothetical protein [Thalassotalea agariperforans]
MSYKEKSIVLSLLITLYLIYAYYSGLINLADNNLLNEESFKALLMRTTTFIITLAVVGHIIMAIIHAKEANNDDDERDKLIEMKSSQSAYLILVLGVIFTVMQVQLGEYVSGGINFNSLSMGYNMMHCIIMSLLLAEVSRYSYQLFYYRRGC